MIDPLRLTMLKNLTSCLEAISIDRGYQYDMEGRVFRGRLTYGEDDPIPMISILEPPLPLESLPPPEDSTASAFWLELVIQGFVDNDYQNPTDPAHYLLADVKKALAREKRKLSSGLALGLNAVDRLVLGPGTVRPPDDVSSRAYFWLSLRVRLAEDHDDPYA